MAPDRVLQGDPEPHRVGETPEKVVAIGPRPVEQLRRLDGDVQPADRQPGRRGDPGPGVAELPETHPAVVGGPQVEVDLSGSGRPGAEQECHPPALRDREPGVGVPEVASDDSVGAGCTDEMGVGAVRMGAPEINVEDGICERPGTRWARTAVHGDPRSGPAANRNTGGDGMSPYGNISLTVKTASPTKPAHVSSIT
jgi:hypothetical protein